MHDNISTDRWSQRQRDNKVIKWVQLFKEYNLNDSAGDNRQKLVIFLLLKNDTTLFHHFTGVWTTIRGCHPFMDRFHLSD